jgi:hypothetical protein
MPAAFAIAGTETEGQPVAARIAAVVVPSVRRWATCSFFDLNLASLPPLPVVPPVETN